MLYSLAFYTPLPERAPTSLLSLDTQISALRFATTLPGGFTGCSVSLNKGAAGAEQRGYLIRQGDVRPFGHVEVHSGGALLYAGRVVQTTRPGGVVETITCEGYGLSAVQDQYWSSQDTSQQTALTLLKKVMLATVPLLRLSTQADQAVDSGVLHTGLEFNGQTPGYILNQFVTEGGNLNIVWDYGVYEDQVLWFKPRAAPDVPDYLVPFDSDVEWTEDYRQMYSGCTVSYQDSLLQQPTVLPTVGGQTPSVLPVSAGGSTTSGAGSTSVTPLAINPTFLDDVGLDRSVQIQGNTMTPFAATQYRDTFLQTAASPLIAAKITRTGGRMIGTIGGGLIPAYLVRAGQWVQVGDQTPLCVVATDVDAVAGSVTIELGAPSPNLPNFLTQIATQVGTLAAGYNVKTGARI